MNNVKITVGFETATTIYDPKKAKEACKQAILEHLKKDNFCSEKFGDGVFYIEILNVRSKKIKI